MPMRWRRLTCARSCPVCTMQDGCLILFGQVTFNVRASITLVLGESASARSEMSLYIVLLSIRPD